MSDTSSRTHDEAFAERYALASWQFDSADQRRKNASRFTRAGMPADLAASAAAMFTTAEDRPALSRTDRTNPAGDSLPVLHRLRIIVPAIEPNLLYIGRGIIRVGPRPKVSTDSDGVYRVLWSSPADHAEATRSLVEYYTAHHEVVGTVAAIGRLDTWHSPFLITGVRHDYADGTPSQTRWMCADGNAMLIGARHAIAADLQQWGVEHPWNDPTGYWPADMATLRTVAAASHDAITSGGAPTTWPVSTGVATQWADFILPGPTRSSHDLGNWLYHEHNTKPRPDTETFPLHEPVRDWIAAVDCFAGLNTESIENIVGADLSTREGREELAAAEEEVERFLTNVTSNKDITAAQLAFAAAALARTDASTLDWPVAQDLQDQPFVTSDWFLKGSIFHSYASRATRRSRENDWLTAAGLNTIREHLATTRSFPSGDLYGVWQDLHGGFYGGGPLADPDNDWFTLTAMWGLSYAALHGHLLFDDLSPASHGEDEADEDVARRVLFTDLPMTVRVMLDTSIGQEVVCYYAEQATRALVPEDRITPAMADMSRRVAALAKHLIAKAEAADADSMEGGSNEDAPQ
jgi:hypothetical protein